MKPYIDVSRNEKGYSEYSIHKLNIQQLHCILACLKGLSEPMPDESKEDAEWTTKTKSLHVVLDESYESKTLNELFSPEDAKRYQRDKSRQRSKTMEKN